MPSFTRGSSSPKQPGNLFNFSFGDSSKMSSFGSSDLPLRNSVAASDRASTIQGASTPKGSGHHGIDRVVRELTRYLDLLRPGKSSQQDGDETTVCGLHIEELLTTPLFSWSVKLALDRDRQVDGRSGIASRKVGDIDDRHLVLDDGQLVFTSLRLVSSLRRRNVHGCRQLIIDFTME